MHPLLKCLALFLFQSLEISLYKLNVLLHSGEEILKDRTGHLLKR